MNINSKNLILLTGAGFTKNFGGLLGSEMWSFIFNHPAVQDNERLRDLLLSEFNYENAYNRVLTDNKCFREEERKIISQVVEDAYQGLDDILKKWNFNNDNPNSLNIYGLRGDFLNLFVGNGQEQGFHFTLNQDIFMERDHFNRQSLGMPKFFKTPTYTFERKNFQRTLDEDGIEKIKDDIKSFGNLLYVKLHGSYGWLSTTGENQMVIGGEKLESIMKEPLLRWYFDIFKNVINQGDKKIVVIGYSFSDKHINNILLQGVKFHKLKIYIINPTNPEQFRINMQSVFKPKDFEVFWKSLSGYYPHSLVDIFPHDQHQHPTVLYQNIKKSIS